MATYLDLVQKLLLYTEKLAYANASTAQIAQALRDINDAYRATYNYGDLSFKTVTERGFVYTVQTDLTLPSRGTPLPDYFMGFHQTGLVYLEDFPSRLPLEYLSFAKITKLIEGPLGKRKEIPIYYGLGGPADPASLLNQREILLWPTPATPTINLKMIFQRACPDDIADISGADVEIPRIPATWHIPVILNVAKMLRKMDKGADESAVAKAVATSISQMNIQEPHGREKRARRQIHPAWVR